MARNNKKKIQPCSIFHYLNVNQFLWKTFSSDLNLSIQKFMKRERRERRVGKFIKLKKNSPLFYFFLLSFFKPLFAMW